jgi:hypothetical protein
MDSGQLQVSKSSELYLFGDEGKMFLRNVRKRLSCDSMLYPRETES